MFKYPASIAERIPGLWLRDRILLDKTHHTSPMLPDESHVVGVRILTIVFAVRIPIVCKVTIFYTNPMFSRLRGGDR